jgi:hypothetical protein
MLARAASVPKQCGLTPILTTARLKDYADMLTLEGDNLIHAAYIMCCKVAAYSTLKVVPPNDRLEIVLERQDRYAAVAAQEIERGDIWGQHKYLRRFCNGLRSRDASRGRETV